MTDTSRQNVSCADVVAGAAPVVVTDAAHHSRYRNNPLVTGELHPHAYAGVPLVGRDGLPLGALCVHDRRARAFSSAQMSALEGLAGHVVALLEQRRQDHADGLLSESVLGRARHPVRLRRALQDGELVPHYQPLVDITTGRVHALEALLRWEHPTLGTLPPAAFLPAVEASALVVPVGRSVLDDALAQLTDLRQRGLPIAGGMSINIAGGQLARPGLARMVLSALDRHTVPGNQLTLEITELTVLPDPELARAELGVLVDAGVHIAVDDFGVGWSNLARVLQLPVDILKLDRSIASAAAVDPRAAAIVTATVALAATLDLQVVAEGVETPPVRAHLARSWCRWAQGWLFSAAVPGASLPHLLERTVHRWPCLQPPSLPHRGRGRAGWRPVLAMSTAAASFGALAGANGPMTLLA